MEKLDKKIRKSFRLSEIGKWPKDWILKLISLFFAVFLWYFVVGADKVDMTVQVPLEIINLPQNLVISNQFKKELEVTVNGPRGIVRGLSDQRISRPVDLSEARPGNRVIHNKGDSISFPHGIRVLRVQPSSLSLLIDRLLEKELPIKPVIKGRPAQGFEISSIIADPATLSVAAPAALIDKEVFLSTKPVDISGMKTNLSKQVILDINPEIAERVGETVINVRVIVTEQRLQSDVKGIPIQFSHKTDRTTYRLDPQTVTIKIDVPYRMRRKVPQADQFTALVEAGIQPPGDHVLPIRVTHPEKDIRVVEVIPSTVKIRISQPSRQLKRKPVYNPIIIRNGASR